jgi:hypothetical protein
MKYNFFVVTKGYMIKLSDFLELNVPFDKLARWTVCLRGHTSGLRILEEAVSTKRALRFGKGGKGV